MSHLKRSILITGASSGIGAYAAGVFAARGWTVWAGYRDEGIVAQMRALPGDIRPIKLDVTDTGSIAAAIAIVTDAGVSLLALLNNAGIAMGGPLEALAIEDIKAVYEVNLFGYVRMIQACLPLLRKSRGRIINMSSLAGIVGVPFLMPYSSSKFAIEGMSDGLRRELLTQGIRVSVIEPGPIDTGIWKKSLAQSETIIDPKKEVTKWYEPMVGNFSTLLRKNHSFSVPQRKLKHALVSACESPHPRLRYVVYRSNFLLSIALWFIPNRLIDRLFRRFLNGVRR